MQIRIRDPGWKKSDPGSGINIPDTQPVLRIRIRMFLGLLDPHPDPLVKGMDPAPDPSISMQK
jgi:hypothetical protein